MSPPVNGADTSESEPAQPVNIASLRSRFESLASDSKGLRETPRPARPARKPVPSLVSARNEAGGEGRREGAGASGLRDGAAHSRDGGGVREQAGDAKGDVGRYRADGLELSAKANPAATSSPQPISPYPTFTTPSHAPVVQRGGRPSAAPSRGGTDAASPQSSLSNAHNGTAPILVAEAAPRPSSPLPLPIVPIVTQPASPPPRDSVTAHADEPPAPSPSVRALLGRFGGGAASSAPSSREPSPHRPAPPPLLGAKPVSRAPSPTPGSATRTSAPPASAVRPLPVPVPTPASTPALTKPTVASVAPSTEDVVFMEEPEEEHSMARRGSSISINQTSTEGVSAAVDITVSPPSSARSPPVRRPSGPRKQSSSSSRQSSANTSPVENGGGPGPSKKAAPAPPIRRPSPAPPTSTVTATDTPTTTPAPSASRGPPPPPPARPSAAELLRHRSSQDGVVPQLNEKVAQVPPALPTRKPSLPIESTGPPPIPSNRPILPSSSVESSGELLLAQSPPRLPNRPRGETVAHSAVSIPAAGGGAPPLPARSDTAPADLPPPPTRTVPASSYVARKPSVRQPVRKDTGALLAPTLPPREANSAPPNRQRTGTLSGSLPDGYQAPPPPTRSANIGPVVAIPPRRSETMLVDLDSEEEDAEDAGAVPVLSSTAKRLLEEYPDSTSANRRPPRFVPDIKISGTSHISSFAVYGRHVCTGTHVVKVYDTLMSDQPILSVDLRETGLDFRVKENRVTAMCFRPTVYESEQGRYLWCGTKDGHLWELDIKTGVVTDTRAFAHSSAVVNIFRYKQWIMSLEEGGKLHVFNVGEGQGKDSQGRDDVRHIPVLCRTIRVQERFNFAKLICGRLWTSSGPVNRSTTNAASKGPTIRVYDPCGPAPVSTLSGGRTAWTSEWTGAVTSATILPLRPNTVYLGHEGGFVSVWEAEELVCTQVLKISPNDVLALEGVGERLWAGSRKGQVSVYDVGERPWRTTNTWIAHPEHAISEMVIDPHSVQDTGRFVLWSLARDALRTWDGLLSVDWVDQQMTLRQPDYCTFREIKTLICSWNIDSARPADLVGTYENTHFFPEMLGSVDSPEIIVFGFQEVIPLTDKKLTAKTLLFGGKGKDSNATADKVSHAYRQWLDKLQMEVHHAYPQTQYVKVHSESLVGLFTCVFVKASERDVLRDVEVTTVKRGIGGIYGNKGAILARMVVDDSSICFINVHLAAGQSAKASRTADLAAIMEDKAVFSSADALPYVRGGDGTSISDHELVFLNGDLNYRIDQRRENVIASVQANDLGYLLEHDQLRKEMRNNHAFRLRHFDEAPIGFKPTYKYNPGEVEYDSSEKKRIPAWCDRILYSKSPRIDCLHYRRYEPTVSDHRPISAAFALTVKAVEWERMKRTRDEVRAEWAKREAEVLGRIEGAYVDLL